MRRGLLKNEDSDLKKILFSLKAILKKDSKILANTNTPIFYISTLPENEGQLYKYKE